MLEPFMLAMSGKLDERIYSHKTPIRFKDPTRAINLIPVDSGILSGDKPLYTRSQVSADEAIWKSAVDNTARIGLRASVENDLISIRSAQSARTPGAAALLLPGRNRRNKIFQTLSENLKAKGKPNVQDCLFVFITPDEILLADKSEFPLTTLKKTIRSIKNQLSSRNAESLLSAEVLEYDPTDDIYREV